MPSGFAAWVKSAWESESEPQGGGGGPLMLWQERFSEPPDERLWSYTVTDTDRRLLADDVEGSLAHVAMLGHVGLLDDEEQSTLARGLRTILEEARAGTFRFVDTDEDVHTAVERRLHELVGPVAGRLHTGRSRNDQIALDIRLYLRRAAERQTTALADFTLALADLTEQAGEKVVAFHTHLQQAQAVPLGHLLLAHAWALVRDRARFIAVRNRLDVSPLGAGAGGGSSLPIDPAFAAKQLGMAAVFANSIDAVASRDELTEYAFCCTQAMVTLSRLAEDIVLWASTEFGWVTFAERFTTGSSALPQKRNPDIAELARGRAARAIGDLTTLLALQKGLPQSYNRDLQEDKRAVFDADDLLTATLSALEGLLVTARFHPPEPSSWTVALDLSEALVGRGVPYKEAHEAVGRLMASLETSGRDLRQAALEDLTAAHSQFSPDDLHLFDPVASVQRRVSPGGGSLSSVRRQIASLRAMLAQ